jgi:hypothetical protein
MRHPNWLLFVANLPGRNQTLRMRIWRALKSAGAVALRDGAYVLPASTAARTLFERQSEDIRQGGGTTYVFEITDDSSETNGTDLQALFDRSADYRTCMEKLRKLRREVARLDETQANRRMLAFKREVQALIAIDFFPGEPRKQVELALGDLEAACNARFSPGEPHAARRRIKRLDAEEYRGRTWATRQGLRVDRVCSAWLIRRFIDPKARFVWLQRPQDCPRRALGFDFDGAAFTHADDRVTFEVLLLSFGLGLDPALLRMGALVHYLDVGGIPVAEAAGLAAIIDGVRTLQSHDDGILNVVTPALDCLYAAYSLSEKT